MGWPRPRGVDIALAAAAVGPSLGAMAARLEAEARPADVLAVTLAVGLGAPMLVRRRWPVAALLVTVALLAGYHTLGYSAIGVVVPLAPALYTVAEAGRLRAGVLVGGSVWLASTGWRVLDPRYAEDASAVLGYDLALSGALLAAVLALGDAVRSRRGWQAELQSRLRAMEEEREAEARRRVAAERMRIARDVHDALGHSVAVVTLHAAVAAEALDDDPETARRSLSTIRAVSREALGDLRTTLGLLREPADGGREPAVAAGPEETRPGEADVAEPVVGLAGLARLVAATRDTGLTVGLTVDGEPEPLPAAVDATAHRIVREALTNVLRHAAATRAHVTVAYGERQLAVTVSDDGRGRTDDRQGHGLLGMQERVALLGGQLRARNRDPAGFEVTAVLPRPADRAGERAQALA
jgi:signal transduction histidine kinase